MKRVVLSLIAAVAAVTFYQNVLATTGELRTPLTRFPIHYPLVHVDDGDWSINCFKNFYMRCADKGFDTCHGTTKVPLAQLFFGKSVFKAQEAFFGGTISYPGACPALKLVTIKPRFKYQEKGIHLGADAEYRFEDSKWRVGGNLSIPFKIIELERNVCSATMTSQEGAEGVDEGEGLDLTGLVCRENETLNVAALTQGRETTAVVPAYRLDFLTGLLRSNGMPMVEYGTGLVRIAGIDIAGRDGNGADTPMVVLKSDDGTCPTERYSSPSAGLNNPTVVAGVQDLIQNNWVTAAGAITGAVTRGAFSSEGTAHALQNYLTGVGADATAQATLFVIPVYESQPGDADSNTEFFTKAVVVMNAIEEAISDLEQNGVQMVEQYFFNNGVHFCQTERRAGVGDLKLDLYVAYGSVALEEAWAKLIVGVVFPTGKKICDPKQLLAQPTGNNGHYEAKVGLAAGWLPYEWFGLHGDISYNYVFKATEKRGAPFKGATVKNIGPDVSARTRWGYFTGHIDLTFFHPENSNLGCTVGYEGYVKSCDKIELCETHAYEFPIRAGCATGGTVLNPDLKELDGCILAKDTKRISHKIRCELFHRWDYCELFAGGSYVIAGKNIMKETEAHIGFGIYW